MTTTRAIALGSLLRDVPGGLYRHFVVRPAS